MFPKSGNLPAIVIPSASIKYAIQKYSVNGALMIHSDFLAPPSAHHDPNTNSTAKQNGLNNQGPAGKAEKSQPNCRATSHKAMEASIVKSGWRSIIQRTGGN